MQEKQEEILHMHPSVVWVDMLLLKQQSTPWLVPSPSTPFYTDWTQGLETKGSKLFSELTKGIHPWCWSECLKWLFASKKLTKPPTMSLVHIVHFMFKTLDACDALMNKKWCCCRSVPVCLCMDTTVLMFAAGMWPLPPLLNQNHSEVAPNTNFWRTKLIWVIKAKCYWANGTDQHFWSGK